MKKKRVELNGLKKHESEQEFPLPHCWDLGLELKSWSTEKKKKIFPMNKILITMSSTSTFLRFGREE
jgi:hypothetical protein